MHYVSDDPSLDQLTEVFDLINHHLVRGNGFLDLELGDGKPAQGKCYSLHCTRNDRSQVSCLLVMDGDSDYPREVNLFDIRSVNGTRVNRGGTEDAALAHN